MYMVFFFDSTPKFQAARTTITTVHADICRFDEHEVTRATMSNSKLKKATIV